jgi:RNA polymerase-binding transcription factor DksA
MNHNITAIKSYLEERLVMLQRRLAGYCETLREPEDEDLDEPTVDLDEDVALECLTADRDELLLIRAALKRIDDGSYGRCLSCRRVISSRRLRVLPEAPTCLRCAQRGLPRIARFEAGASLSDCGSVWRSRSAL